MKIVKEKIGGQKFMGQEKEEKGKKKRHREETLIKAMNIIQNAAGGKELQFVPEVKLGE